MRRSLFIAYSMAIICCASAVALAPLTGGDFDLTWHTIDGGGGTSTGGGFQLAGTIGQHDASAGSMTGGRFALIGGFWAGTGAAPGDPCPWDLNDDGGAGPADLAIILGNWGPVPPNDPLADLTGDGQVGPADLAIVLGNWGPCP